ncbi:MAG: hypothetical protein ACRC92_27595 [Peptostreptococcaceae bacterium]
MKLLCNHCEYGNMCYKLYTGNECPDFLPEDDNYDEQYEAMLEQESRENQ